jgi:hypothetical protein
MEQYESNISDYRFEHDSNTSRIAVYKEGGGVEPVTLIKVKDNISLKEFHYEIMHWACNNNVI